MGTSWHQLLAAVCAEVCDVADCDVPVETVLFYVARWCQKETGELEPGVASLDQDDVAAIAARVVNNLGEDGARVDRLVAGDADAWTELRRLLYASAHSRTDALAGDYADEALQKIAVVLLTGTPPSHAAVQLVEAIEGPSNEYVFTSPFPFWARAVVINLIVDDKRRRAREREAPQAHATRKPPCLDRATLERAHEALPGLLDAIRDLPSVQRSVMAWTLARHDLDPLVTERLRQLAPDMFGTASAGARASEAGAPDTSGAPASDADIAALLGTTTRLVAANRSAARCKLAARDPHWKLLLDVLLPHRSTRPAQEEDHHG